MKTRSMKRIRSKSKIKIKTQHGDCVLLDS